MIIDFFIPNIQNLRNDQGKHSNQNSWWLYEGESTSNQPIPFPMDWDGHDFHALFQYIFYPRVQNCTRI